MIYPENLSIGIITYIKNTMKKEGIFYAREPLAINSTNFNQSAEFCKYPSKLREYGMNDIIKSGYLGKDIIVLYRTTYKSNIKWDMSFTASKTDDELNMWLKSNADSDGWLISPNRVSKVPFIFFNIDVIESMDAEPYIKDDKWLFLHIKSYSGRTDALSILKDEYDDIVERIKSLERYDILLRIES